MSDQALAAPAPARAPVAFLLLMALAAGILFPASVWCGYATAALEALKPAAAASAASTRPAAAAPFHLVASPGDRQLAVRCLTDAIYYEAGEEPTEGQRAVAQVVINRLRDPHFPKSVCGVVYEGWQLKTGCQFSFVCDGSIRRRHAVPALWDRLRPLAEQALDGYVVPEVGASTHYYADYVRPYWLVSVNPVIQIGRQIFCAWRGGAGLATALTGQYAGGEARIGEAALDGARPAPAHVSRLGRVVGRLRIAAIRHEERRG